MESRSGQGFSRPAVATAITASGIVTKCKCQHYDENERLVATAITASGIVTESYRCSDLPSNMVATAITASGIVTYYEIVSCSPYVATAITASGIVTL